MVMIIMIIDYYSFMYVSHQSGPAKDRHSPARGASKNYQELSSLLSFFSARLFIIDTTRREITDAFIMRSGAIELRKTHEHTAPGQRKRREEIARREVFALE